MTSYMEVVMSWYRGFTDLVSKKPDRKPISDVLLVRTWQKSARESMASRWLQAFPLPLRLKGPNIS